VVTIAFGRPDGLAIQTISVETAATRGVLAFGFVHQETESDPCAEHPHFYDRC
jgi:hypothetical protein